jgi:hypothetical protein
VRLGDIADTLGITERRAHGIVTDLAEAGYVVKQKDGRRNRYPARPGSPGVIGHSDRRAVHLSQFAAGQEDGPF